MKVHTGSKPSSGSHWRPRPWSELWGSFKAALRQLWGSSDGALSLLWGSSEAAHNRLWSLLLNSKYPEGTTRGEQANSSKTGWKSNPGGARKFVLNTCSCLCSNNPYLITFLSIVTELPLASLSFLMALWLTFSNTFHPWFCNVVASSQFLGPVCAISYILRLHCCASWCIYTLPWDFNILYNNYNYI